MPTKEETESEETMRKRFRKKCARLTGKHGFFSGNPRRAILAHRETSPDVSDSTYKEIKNLSKLSVKNTEAGANLRSNLVFMFRSQSQADMLSVVGGAHPVHHTKKFAEMYKVEGKVLGTGATGEVKVIQKVSNNQKYALKTVQLNRIRKKDILYFLQEVELLTQLDHPNVIRLIETYQEKGRLHMIFELCTGGELFDKVVEKGYILEKDTIPIARKMVGAIAYLHSKNICHRDIKMENFIFDADGEIKLIDFGLSLVYAENEEYHKVCGSLHSMAPEVMGGHYTESCDMWSLGVAIYTMLAGYRPFEGRSREEIVSAILDSALEFPEADWKGMSKASRQFLRGMMAKDPKQRLTAQQALEHPWLNGTGDPSGTMVTNDTLQNMRQFRKYSNIKKMALHAIAYHLGSEELRTMRAQFHAMDPQSKGYITADEFVQVVAKQKQWTTDKVKEVFSGIDFDNTGQIEYTEFLAAAINKRLYLEEETLYNAFLLMDTDDDGFITVENLATVLGEGVGRDEIEAMLYEVNKKPFGEEGHTAKIEKISFEDFQDIMRQEVDPSVSGTGRLIAPERVESVREKFRLPRMSLTRKSKG